MKRRSFLKGLGVALIAPASMLSRGLEAAVPQAPKSNYRPHPTGMTVRTGLPPTTWRKLHEGVEPPITATEGRRRQGQFYNEINRILQDLSWKLSS